MYEHLLVGATRRLIKKKNTNWIVYFVYFFLIDILACSFPSIFVPFFFTKTSSVNRPHSLNEGRI